MSTHELRSRLRFDVSPAITLLQALRLPGPQSRSFLRSHAAATPTSTEAPLSTKLTDVFLRTYYLGFISFGGPPAHFQIFHRSFVQGKDGQPPWIDEQTYQELFAICQALPGPASTKMLFCITLLQAGFLAALAVFLLWSLPVAFGMYGLALGIQKINQVLPDPVYALLSGLNASTVAIIALAAVQLARKAITDPLTRLLVTAAACAGVCYNALWYFPVIMVIGGLTTLTWDCWLRGTLGRWKARREKARLRANLVRRVEENGSDGTQNCELPMSPPSPASSRSQRDSPDVEPAIEADHAPRIPVWVGLAIIITFFCSFTAIMVIRGTISTESLDFQLFSNMYLAGTIIFGGGPVVIPLLREYVVQPGWVSPRDFLIGLAIIQALPGPNFNFAVYLGALALSGSPHRMFFGSVLGFIGIFLPGLVLAVGFQSIWRAVRGNPFVVSALRGVNASAVGLVFTAVYRLWEIGYLTAKESSGTSLGTNPWWVAITASTYVFVESFNMPAPMAIVIGGLAGVAWWGAVGR